MGMASEMRTSSSDMSKYTTGMAFAGGAEEISICSETRASDIRGAEA